MLCKVVHFRKEQYDIYIGRGSKWGNPYSHKEGTLAQFKVSSRKEAIESYEKWIMTQDHLMSSLPDLKGKVLGCWCKPQSCHGDVLKKLVDSLDRGLF
jgi:hypothetical protein